MAAPLLPSFCHRSAIGGIERGERNFVLRNIESIAQTLGITLAELMEGLSPGQLWGLLNVSLTELRRRPLEESSVFVRSEDPPFKVSSSPLSVVHPTSVHRRVAVDLPTETGVEQNLDQSDRRIPSALSESIPIP